MLTLPGRRGPNVFSAAQSTRICGGSSKTYERSGSTLNQMGSLLFVWVEPRKHTHTGQALVKSWRLTVVSSLTSGEKEEQEKVEDAFHG